MNEVPYIKKIFRVLTLTVFGVKFLRMNEWKEFLDITKRFKLNITLKKYRKKEKKLFC